MLSLCCDLPPLTALAPSVVVIGAVPGTLGSVGTATTLAAVTGAGAAAAAFLACAACRPVGFLIALSLCKRVAYATGRAATDGAGAAACEATGGEAGTEAAAGTGAEAAAGTGAGLAISMALACFVDGWQGGPGRAVFTTTSNRHSSSTARALTVSGEGALASRDISKQMVRRLQVSYYYCSAAL